MFNYSLESLGRGVVEATEFLGFGGKKAEKGMTIELPSVGQCYCINANGGNSSSNGYTVWAFKVKVMKTVANFAGWTDAIVFLPGWGTMLADKTARTVDQSVGIVENNAKLFEDCFLDILRESQPFARRFPDIAEKIKSGKITDYNQITHKGNDLFFQFFSWSNRLVTLSRISVVKQKTNKDVYLYVPVDVTNGNIYQSELSEDDFRRVGL